MKTYLLPNTGQFYKTNLHSHSTVSDGAKTPEELKKIYKSHGYSALAITDHELLVDHSYLNDDDFIMITGFEYAFVEDVPYKFARTAEFNCYPIDPHNVTQPCFNPKYVIHGEKWRAQTAKYDGEYTERPFTVEAMQNFITKAKELGFIVGLNHPVYSRLDLDTIKALDGLYALEIFNTVSFFGGSNEYNTYLYDALLRYGKKLFCVANDDCHPAIDPSDPSSDCCKGFVMIKAEELSHKALLSAMEKGNFYSSMGPEIKELYIEDGKIHIQTSPVSRIMMSTYYRNGGRCCANSGEYITEAIFDYPADDKFFYFEVRDKNGNCAHTNAYFIDELKI